MSERDQGLACCTLIPVVDDQEDRGSGLIPAEDAIGLGLAWSKVADFEPLVFTDIAGQTFKIDSVANENQYTA